MLIILFSNDQNDKISNPFFTQSKKINNYFMYQDGKPFLSEEVLNTLLETEKYIIKMNKKNKSFSNFSFFEKLKKYILLKAYN